MIERGIYTLFDLFGDTGGIIGIIYPIIAMFVKFQSIPNLNSIITRKLF